MLRYHFKTLIQEKISGLSEDQASRVEKMFENKSFEDVEKSIDDMVDIVINEENKSETEETNDESQQEEIISENDGIQEEKPKIVSETSEFTKKVQKFL